MARSRPDPRTVALDVWPALLAVLLVLPLWTGGGYPLARDLVFVPHQPLTAASLGLGDVAPRAVPLDALVALASQLVDGAVLARVLVPGALMLAGWGVHRLVGDLGTLARLAAGGLAVWNPFVVERLALGQWALLAAYGALPWIVLAARRLRFEDGWRPVAVATLWLGLASITPTGGLLGAATLLVCGARGVRRTALLAAIAVVLQLPWLLPGLVGSAATTSDPTGVAVFAPTGAGPGGVVVALAGLGGIWDARSEPASRGTVLAVGSALLVVVVLAAGWRVLRRSWGTSELSRVAALAAAGAALAALGTTDAGRELLGWLVTTVPGGGLLRDGQKFLAPLVVLTAAAAGATVHRVLAWGDTRGVELRLTVLLLGLLTPLALLPDATTVTWPTVRPLDYPVGLDRVDGLLTGQDGDLATLPWRSYRRFDWGHGLVSSDPAVRWFDRDVLVSDDLVVGEGTVVRGESPRAGRIGAALEIQPPATALAGEGVSWVLVYRDDPAVEAVDLTGLEPVYEDTDLAIYAVPDPGPRPDPDSTARRVLVVAADLVAALLLVAAAAGLVVARIRRRGEPATGS